MGSVIGRGIFSNYFQFRQNCTVGNNHGLYPRFGKNVQLWSGVTVIGNCDVGNDVILASGTFVKDEDIPSESVVFGSSPNLVIKDRSSLRHNEKSHFFLDTSL
jgi:serine O-acetyltransferase